MEEDLDNILDDWFIESIKIYKDLHVYQLENPTQVLEWTSGRNVCVAGYTSSSKNEILELHLPLKLLADKNKGLCAERDFKVVHGGFADGPVRRLRHIPGTRCAVTNDGHSSSLQVWDLGGDDSDVIRRTGSVEGGRTGSVRGSRIAARPSSQPQVLHGAQSDDVRLTEITSGRTVYKLEVDSSDALSSLQFVTDSIVVAGCCKGSILVADIRSPAAPQVCCPPASSAESVLWWTDASASSSRLIRLSSCGQAVVSELRMLGGGAVCQAQLDIQMRGSDSEDVVVSWAPALDDCIAVSGFSGAVQIYNTSLWKSDLQETTPLFQHRGHMVSSQQPDGVLTTAHAWHPERPRTLLSAASDGSVHVWDWVNQSAAESGSADPPT
ncbi:integrator complex assembly factor WDR73 [Sphaeramia orbicularis]|uniref:WD repeat domain 73 n=1 Tax=Sphaeramia orbicularis TaxID=375764 RepID=A0A673A115_9TELE|nr:WD repeat-containing protein 73 [Sphaeramia orbicularis]